MAHAFASWRFREQIEALVRAICAIRGHAIPDEPALDAIIRQEAGFLMSLPDAQVPVFDSGTVARVAEAVMRWHIQSDEDEPAFVADDSDPPT